MSLFDQHLARFSLNNVTSRPLHWLWHQRIPLAHLTVLYGLPGSGLSLLSLTLAAIVTSGRSWPDGSPCSQGHVVLVAPSDSPAHSIKPRLEAAGGDPSRILLLNTVTAPAPTSSRRNHSSLDSQPASTTIERPFSFAEDLPLLEDVIRRSSAQLVILDSPELTRESLLRPLLPRLAHLAAQTGCAILLVRPLTKSLPQNLDPSRLHALPNLAAVHSALLLAPHPDDEQSRLLLAVKHSLSLAPVTLALAISEQTAGLAVPIISWQGEFSFPPSATQQAQEEQASMRQTLLGLLQANDTPLTRDILLRLFGNDPPVHRLLQRLLLSQEIVSPAPDLFTTPGHPCLQQFEP